jgi:hypothetical protein
VAQVFLSQELEQVRTADAIDDDARMRRTATKFETPSGRSRVRIPARGLGARYLYISMLVFVTWIKCIILRI